MKLILSKLSILVFFVVIIGACNQIASFKASADSSSRATSANTNDKTGALLDTTKLKSDLNDIISSVASGNPDTTKLKNAGADILSTDAAVLSDSGIDKMYGNDPAAKQAAGMLKNWRNKMGITPDKLDSIKKAAAELKQGASH